MTDRKNDQQQQEPGDNLDTRSENLFDSPMMAHLRDALQAGEDIGHYGRLVFTMVAQYFMDDEELVDLLGSNLEEDEARALVAQVRGKEYNPPKRDRILEWQREQEFPICPDPDDPQSCNVYRELRFPEEVYTKVEEFWIDKSGTD